MSEQNPDLPQLGWSNFFISQLDIEEIEHGKPVRVTEVHRNAVDTISPDGAQKLPMEPAFAQAQIAVGDWILISDDQNRVLDRKSVLHRRAAGHEAVSQTIAANIDTLFITSSCNADFNLARLERYLALAHQAEVEPVVVLTKSDMAENSADYRAKAQQALAGVIVETLNAKDVEETQRKLGPWCGSGQTIALLGSSGVGKTTLTNALTGGSFQTQDIREDDARGRHTTTARSMHQLTSGGWLIDTPGMRELQLVDVAEGIDAVFADISSLAENCKFNDCAHETEPGCAIQAAIEIGELDEDRLKRWQKLQREDQYNTETVAQSRERFRKLNKKYAVGKARSKMKRGDFS